MHLLLGVQRGGQSPPDPPPHPLDIVPWNIKQNNNNKMSGVYFGPVGQRFTCGRRLIPLNYACVSSDVLRFRV